MQSLSLINQFVVGITGNLGCGKSTVGKILSEKGATVIEADDLAREAVLRGSKTLQKIVDVFGTDILLPDGTLDRCALGNIVFKNRTNLTQLEEIIHPEIRRLFVDKLEEIPDRKLVVFVLPLLFESKIDYPEIKKIVTIIATPENMYRRVKKRDGLSRNSFEERLSFQLPSDLKAAKSDYVILNNGSIDDLISQVIVLHTHLLEDLDKYYTSN